MINRTESLNPERKNHSQTLHQLAAAARTIIRRRDRTHKSLTANTLTDAHHAVRSDASRHQIEHRSVYRRADRETRHRSTNCRVGMRKEIGRAHV